MKTKEKVDTSTKLIVAGMIACIAIWWLMI